MSTEQKQGSKIRVAMIGTSPTTQGGVSTVINVLREAGLFERCSISYFSSHCDGSSMEKSWRALVTWLVFLQGLLHRNFDIVHLHMASRASFWRKLFFIIPSYLFAVPYVVHLHGAEFKTFFGTEANGITRRCITWAFEYAACVVALSKSWGQWLTESFPLARVRVVYNPVVIRIASPANVIKERAEILFLGRLGQRKGTFDLIHAFKQVHDAFPHTLLRLAGDGETALARELADRLGIGTSVEILGWINSDQKYNLLNSASVFALPSYNEGLPMSVLEAMATGVAIVTTPVGGIPEALENRVSGLLVPPGDRDSLASAITSLLNDTEYRQRIGGAAFDRARSIFSADAIVDQVCAVYESVRRKDRA